MVLALGGMLTIAKWDMWFAPDRKPSLRPTTINNVTLRIETNVIRIQNAMQDMMFSKYPKQLDGYVLLINQLEAVVYSDFVEMGNNSGNGNVEYQKALSLFHEWKKIRDKVLELASAKSTMRAEDMVRGQSAAQSMKIRMALKSLNVFSEKRAENFDAAMPDAPTDRQRNQ